MLHQVLITENNVQEVSHELQVDLIRLEDLASRESELIIVRSLVDQVGL